MNLRELASASGLARFKISARAPAREFGAAEQRAAEHQRKQQLDDHEFEHAKTAAKLAVPIATCAAAMPTVGRPKS